jgi:hypothetical protein
MKKSFLFVCSLVIGMSAFGQTIPNGDMELWRSDSAGVGHKLNVKAPNNWYGADSLFIGMGQSFGPLLSIPDTVWHQQLFREDVTTHGGAHSAKLITAVQDTIMAPGVLSNAQTKITITGLPFSPKISGITYSGGAIVNVKPTSVSAWVQYVPGMDTSMHPAAPSNDSGYLLVQALHHFGTVDSIIGSGRVAIGPSASWVQITANITYPKDSTDSISLLRITFSSSGGGLTLPVDSSTLYADDVTMTSVPNPAPIDHSGVRVITSHELVSVYPNPANGTIYFNCPQNVPVTCKLFSASGRVVATKTMTGNDALDVAKLPGGLYFYTLYGENETIIQRGKITLN